MLMQKSYTGTELMGIAPQLRALPQPVTALHVQGELKNLLDRPWIAIVGSRKVSPYGRIVTQKIATELARAGVVIISGLALGVDSIAHTATLDAGGDTIAVLPTGLDRIYPASHHNLARRIVKQGGALISEYPDGQGAPMKHQFIARNRIIAALSQAVIIPEAAAKSGSLHTANFALEQGIEVFAVPGNITSLNSAGTNQLIKDGAHCLTNAHVIFEALDINAVQNTNPKLNNTESIVIAALSDRSMDFTELKVQTRLSTSRLLQTLTILEIQGLITQQGEQFILR